MANLFAIFGSFASILIGILLIAAFLIGILLSLAVVAAIVVLIVVLVKKSKAKNTTPQVEDNQENEQI